MKVQFIQNLSLLLYRQSFLPFLSQESLTDERLEAVGHGMSKVRLPAQVGSVGVEHEAIQLQLLEKRRVQISKLPTDTSAVAARRTKEGEKKTTTWQIFIKEKSIRGERTGGK